MRLLKLTFPGTPQPKGRLRTRVVVPKNGGAPFATFYTPKETEQEEERIGKLALAAVNREKWSKPTGPVAVLVHAVFRIPDSCSRKEALSRRWHTQKPDEDNIGKLVKDACNGIVWADDAQISCPVGPVKTWAMDREGLEVWVCALDALPEQVGEEAAVLCVTIGDFLRKVCESLQGRIVADGLTVPLFGE